LWLRLVGTFAVHRHGQPLCATEVGSRKARTVLALLAVEPGQLVPVDRVIEVL
jgi:DNA-binding SARP family transcriptional activator